MSVAPNAITVYAGRLSLTLPSQASVQINGADYDGVQISEPYEKSLATGSTLESLRDKRVDELWKLHVKQVDESFGPGKSIVIRRDPVEAHPAMLYRALPGSTLGAQDKVIQELWTLIDGHIISLSIQGLNREQPATFAVLTRVLHALGPSTGPVDANVFVAPGCYVHLPPAVGESVQAVVGFGSGYDLTLSTDVFKHVHSPDVQQRLRSGTLPDFATSQQIESGSASAGPLAGEQAAVRLKGGYTASYIAEFGFGGVDGGDSVRPTTSLRLTADERNAGVVQASFLGTWHAVLAGFTVRSPRGW